MFGLLHYNFAENKIFLFFLSGVLIFFSVGLVASNAMVFLCLSISFISKMGFMYVMILGVLEAILGLALVMFFLRKHGSDHLIFF